MSKLIERLKEENKLALDHLKNSPQPRIYLDRIYFIDKFGSQKMKNQLQRVYDNYEKKVLTDQDKEYFKKRRTVDPNSQTNPIPSLYSDISYFVRHVREDLNNEAFKYKTFEKDSGKDFGKYYGKDYTETFYKVATDIILNNATHREPFENLGTLVKVNRKYVILLNNRPTDLFELKGDLEHMKFFTGRKLESYKDTQGDIVAISVMGGTLVRVKNIQANPRNTNEAYQQAVKKYNDLFKLLKKKIQDIEIYQGFEYPLNKSYPAVQELYKIRKQLENIYVNQIQPNQ